eukprot:6190426-Pleurochrysis_carterae.AAC.1
MPCHEVKASHVHSNVWAAATFARVWVRYVCVGDKGKGPPLPAGRGPRWRGTEAGGSGHRQS